MGREIERKFLVNDDSWRAAAQGTAMRQGYLCTEPDRTVRVRLAGDQAWMTVKGRNVGFTRAEFEWSIPPADALELLETLCLRPQIEKVRYRIEHAGRIWEVDEFSGENAGLVVAEVELPSEDASVVKPPWVGQEVTGDARYGNSSLVARPFNTWSDASLPG
jgi:adenylate cyclase